MTCAAMCVATNKCTGYNIDNSKCLLHESWRFMDAEPNENMIVFGQKLPGKVAPLDKRNLHCDLKSTL